MNRRELLKALPALPAISATPLFIQGKEVGKALAVDVKPEKAYVIFLNAELVDVNEWCQMDHPRALRGTPVYAVFPGRDTTMDEIIRIYEVKDR